MRFASAPFLIAALVFCPFIALAQMAADGSADPSGGLPATSTLQAASPVTAVRATSSAPEPALSAGSGTAPEPVSIPNPAPSAVPGPSVTTPQLPPAPQPPLIQIDRANQGMGDERGTGSIAGIIFAAVAGIGAAFVAVKFLLRGKHNADGNSQKKEDARCDDIRSLLEQKKKELEEMLQKWPEDKLKAMAKGVIMKELKKDEDIKSAIETFEEAKKKYDALKGAIELLERKYDLCMLKLPSAGRVKAAIFDLNGVFIQSPKLSERFLKEFHVPVEKFLPALAEVMAKVRLPGAGDLYAYWKPHFDEWGIALSREQFFDFWFGAEKEASEMTELARELKKKGFRIFILSDNFRERTEYYAKNFPALGEIPEKIYYSWQTGHVKTSAAAHQIILEENDLKPGECIFFDDSQKNIEVARSLGMNAHVFESPAQVKKLLG